MAKKKAAAEGQVKARVLALCTYGKPDDVAVLGAEEAATAQAQGLVDTTPEAVAYAESLIPEEQEAKA